MSFGSLLTGSLDELLHVLLLLERLHLGEERLFLHLADLLRGLPQFLGILGEVLAVHAMQDGGVPRDVQVALAALLDLEDGLRRRQVPEFGFWDSSPGGGSVEPAEEAAGLVMGDGAFSLPSSSAFLMASAMNLNWAS